MFSGGGGGGDDGGDDGGGMVVMMVVMMVVVVVMIISAANANWFPTIGPEANSNTTAAIDAILNTMLVFGFINKNDSV